MYITDVVQPEETNRWKSINTHTHAHTSSKRFSLYLNKKLKIKLHRNSNMLKYANRIRNKCRRRNKYALIYDGKE